MAAVTLADVRAARRTIASVATHTPLLSSPFLSRLAGTPFLLKLETTQPTGAFKLRGAANAIFNLDEGVTGVTCCSTGNHGRGVAYAAGARNLRAVVCMSSLVPRNKIDAIAALGADVRITGDSQDAALAASRQLVRERGLTEISPFDDPLVIAGQGTIGIELVEQRPELDTIIVPLSGGGLAGGVAVAAKGLRPDCRVIGVSMERGAAMHESIKAGHPVEVEEVPSLADSLGGGIGLDNRLSFALCRDLLDDVVLVSEEEIYRAIRALYFEDGIVAEGAAAVGVAALLAGRLRLGGGPAATIVTGRNIDMSVHAAVIAGADVAIGDYTVRAGPHAA